VLIEADNASTPMPASYVVLRRARLSGRNMELQSPAYVGFELLTTPTFNQPSLPSMQWSRHACVHFFPGRGDYPPPVYK
jgi:hypothetical protein